MKVYVMRHGKTVWNEIKRIQGRSNNRLGKVGKEATQEVASLYKDVQFDIIFCSPLMRTMQTANIMNQYHKARIVRDERLIEINQGIFTKRMKSSLTENEKLQRQNRNESCGMEKYESVYERVKAFLEDLKQQNCKSVLVVTHNVNASLIENILTSTKVDFNNNKHLLNFNNSEIKCFDL